MQSLEDCSITNMNITNMDSSNNNNITNSRSSTDRTCYESNDSSDLNMYHGFNSSDNDNRHNNDNNENNIDETTYLLSNKSNNNEIHNSNIIDNNRHLYNKLLNYSKIIFLLLIFGTLLLVASSSSLYTSKFIEIISFKETTSSSKGISTAHVTSSTTSSPTPSPTLLTSNSEPSAVSLLIPTLQTTTSSSKPTSKTEVVSVVTYSPPTTMPTVNVFETVVDADKYAGKPTLSPTTEPPTYPPGEPTPDPTTSYPTMWPTISISPTAAKTLASLDISFKRYGYSKIETTSDVLYYEFLKDYAVVMEPYADMIPILADLTSDDRYYNYTICLQSETSMFDDCQTGTITYGNVPSFNFECKPFDELYINLIEYHATTDILLRESTDYGICMYVRREIRQLTADDLSATMDAMHTMWEYSEADGQALFGEKYHENEYFVSFHYFNAAWQDSDHIHEGNGFLTQHIKITNMFEEAMQAVDPRVSIPYWDFTIDSANGTTISESYIMTADVFGSMTLPTNPDFGYTFQDDSILDGAIKDGRWAYTPVYDSNPFDDLRYNYGFLRAPWNQNPSPYLSRFLSNLDTSLPDCGSHYTAIQQTDLNAFTQTIEAGPHAKTHVRLGGTFGCDLILPMYEKGLISSYQAFIDVCGNWVFTLKEFYRENYLIPNKDCEVDEDDINNSYCGFTCNDPDDTMITDITNKLQGSAPDNMTRADWESWRDFICEGDGQRLIYGEHLESASPSDPSFWVIHPTLERLFQAKLMSGGFETSDWATDQTNDYVCDKPTCYQSDVDEITYSDECCIGHFEWSKMLDPVEGNRSMSIGLTNGEVIEMTDPTNPDYSMTYIYGDFDWSHCYEIDHLTNFDALFVTFSEKYTRSPTSFPTAAPSSSQAPTHPTEQPSILPTMEPTIKPTPTSPPTLYPQPTQPPTTTARPTPTSNPTPGKPTSPPDATKSPSSTPAPSYTPVPTVVVTPSPTIESTPEPTRPKQWKTPSPTSTIMDIVDSIEEFAEPTPEPTGHSRPSPPSAPPSNDDPTNSPTVAVITDSPTTITTIATNSPTTSTSTTSSPTRRSEWATPSPTGSTATTITSSPTTITTIATNSPTTSTSTTTTSSPTRRSEWATPSPTGSTATTITSSPTVGTPTSSDLSASPTYRFEWATSTPTSPDSTDDLVLVTLSPTFKPTTMLPTNIPTYSGPQPTAVPTISQEPTSYVLHPTIAPVSTPTHTPTEALETPTRAPTKSSPSKDISPTKYPTLSPDATLEPTPTTGFYTYSPTSSTDLYSPTPDPTGHSKKVTRGNSNKKDKKSKDNKKKSKKKN